MPQESSQRSSSLQATHETCAARAARDGQNSEASNVRMSAKAKTQDGKRGGWEVLSEKCPIRTEGWTRRVHFVREGGRGGEICARAVRPRAGLRARWGAAVRREGREGRIDLEADLDLLVGRRGERVAVPRNGKVPVAPPGTSPAPGIQSP